MPRVKVLRSGREILVPDQPSQEDTSSAATALGTLSNNGIESDEEERSVTPAPVDAGNGANVDFPDLAQHMLGTIQDIVRDMGLDKGSTTYKAFAMDNIADGTYKGKLSSFLAKNHPEPERSLVPVGAFASNNERSTWDTHCPKIDGLWGKYVQSVEPLLGDDYDLSWLCKPSGPLVARLLVLWHYPTINTPNKTFSHSMDQGNPSLRSQKYKIGLPDDVRTQDVNPIRVPYSHGVKPEWEKQFNNWDQIERLNYKFTVATCLDVPFVLVLGKQPFEVLKLAHRSRQWTLQALDIKLKAEHQMFQQPLRVYLSVSPGGNVKQVVIRCFHAEYAFYTPKLVHGAMMDFMWNLACEIAGVSVHNSTYFSFKVNSNSGRIFDSAKSEMKINATSMLHQLWKRELESDRQITMEEVEIYFASKIAAVPGLRQSIEDCAQQGESLLSPMWKLSRDRGAETLRDRNQKRNQLLPPPKAPARKRLKNENNDGGQSKKASHSWQMSTAGQAALAGQAKGRETIANRMEAKYQALLNLHQIRQLEIARVSGTLTGSQSQAMTRLNAIKRYHDSDDRNNLTNSLARYTIFYHPIKYPRGVRFEGDGGPPQEVDPYANQDHPACVILLGSRLLRTSEQKNALAGPET
ncbi:hypothetical protein CEK26_012951 [Fusarium fujikuroi]|nr:hypothetical protein CEK26_012951 [Fusarium fujikuroi]